MKDDFIDKQVKEFDDIQSISGEINQLRRERACNRAFLSKRINQKISNVSIFITSVTMIILFAFFKTEISVFASFVNSLLISGLFGFFCKKIIFIYFEEKIRNFLIENNEDINNIYKRIKSLTLSINLKKEELAKLEIKNNHDNDEKNTLPDVIDEVYFNNLSEKNTSINEIYDFDRAEKSSTQYKKLVKKRDE